MAKYKTLTEKWAAEDAAAAAAKRGSAKSAPASSSKKPDKSAEGALRGRDSQLKRALREAGASIKKPKSGRRYT